MPSTESRAPAGSEGKAPPTPNLEQCLKCPRRSLGLRYTGRGGSAGLSDLFTKITLHPPTILVVGRHMPQQPHRYDPRARPQGQQRVAGDCVAGMQRVVADTAATRIEDGCGQQVVQVDQHGSQHDEPGALPPVAEEEPGDEPRNEEVEGVVDEGLEHDIFVKCGCFFSSSWQEPLWLGIYCVIEYSALGGCGILQSATLHPSRCERQPDSGKI